MMEAAAPREVWLCIPSKRPPAEVEPVLAKWRELGYNIAIQRDPGENFSCPGVVSYVRLYTGYPEAVNFLAREVLSSVPWCDWIVAAGDDTLPDPNKSAEEIAEECSEHFAGPHRPGWPSGTFGVMQPTGDPWSDKQGRIIERVAGSPWLGREWCLRANQGKGPLWPEFFHMFADETLQCVAQKLGVFWQRPDLTHLHHHWGRPKEGERLGNVENMPAFLKQANSCEEWLKSKREFERLKADGFRECIPL